MFPTLTELPENAVKVTSGVEFYRLVKGKRSIKKDNVEVGNDIKYCVKSGDKQVYYIRYTKPSFELRTLREFIKEGRVYLLMEDEYTEELINTLHLTNLSYDEFFELITLYFKLDHHLSTNRKALDYIVIKEKYQARIKELESKSKK